VILEKKVKLKKVKEVTVNTDSMASYSKAWLQTLESKMYLGFQYHVEGGSYHFFCKTEQDADYKVRLIQSEGHDLVYKNSLMQSVARLRKYIREFEEMWSKYHTGYKLKARK
jgi:hypothetical protein